MNDDVTPAEAALRSLDVPEDVAERHLARLLAPGTAWASAAPAPGTGWASNAPGTGWAEHATPGRRRRSALRATAAGAVMSATLLSGAGVAAASTATPGDPLYGLKTARERVQLAMAREGDDRARLELKLARTRLGEAAALLRLGRTQLAIETLARADAALASAIAQGGTGIDADAASELDRRREVLGLLLDGGLPDKAADAAREALERTIEHQPGPGATVAPTSRPATPAKPKPTPTATATATTTAPTKPPATVKPTTKPTPRATEPTKRPRPTGRPTEKPSKSPKDADK